LEALRPICEEAAKERNTAYGTLRSSVENELQKLLPHCKANRPRVAKALGLTERTLVQKLGEENTSYEKVVDRLRHSLALQYIKEPSALLAQIAGCSAMRGRPPSIMLSRAGRADRRQRREATISVQATIKFRNWATPRKLEH
jgi:hypothetical protein